MLRDYRDADLPAVQALHKSSFAALARHDHSAEQIAAHCALIDAAPYALDLRRSHLIVAEDAEGIAGTAGWLSLDGEPATARIRKVFVRPDLARRGLGRTLVEAAEAAASVAGGHKRFFVRANVNAVALYRALGYRAVESGAMPAGHGVELPVVYMRRD